MQLTSRHIYIYVALVSSLTTSLRPGQGLPELSPLLDSATEQIVDFRPHELAAAAKAAALLCPKHPGGASNGVANIY